MTVELLSQLIEQPFYDDLRTRQQLGYLVFSGTGFDYADGRPGSLTRLDEVNKGLLCV